MKEDFRKQKELEEGRKAGLIPAEKDEEGNDINPHIPQYIVKAPWYINTGASSLKHQRVRKSGEEDSEAHHTRGIITTDEPVTRFRKGACENCGSMTHKVKDCLERPRKIGAKFKPTDIKQDEFLETAELSFDGKRDRWAGYDADEYVQVIDTYAAVEEERLRIKEAETEAALQRKLEKGEGESSSSSDSSSDSSDSDSDGDEEKYAEAADMPGQKVDSKGRITVRNLRLREDTAKYLRNLDPSSAYYDPKTRSMRDNPHPEAEDPSLLPFAGDNFVRQSGDAIKLPQLQVFAWQASDRGVPVNLQANPSLAEKLHREYESKKSDEALQREKMLAEAYGDGNDDHNDESEPEDNLLDIL